MTQLITTYLPWLLSCITIYMTILAGNNNRNAWAVGLVAQVGWVIWILASESWGFLPMNIAMWLVYMRNHRKWALK
jgi:hypothetical protein